MSVIIEFNNLRDVSETVQEFILQDSIPMPKGETTMISAKGGVGKTNLSLLITSEYINNHNGNVALWLTEDDSGNVKHRINKMLENKVINPFDELRAKLITTNPIHFAKSKNREFITDEESLNAIKLFCVENDIRLLILDPLLAFYGGNENDNGQARTFMQPFINWCKEIDINIVLIHHSAKGDISNTRGAGAFSDACRCAYVVTSPLIEANNKVVEDKIKSAEGIRIITCTKDNRGAMIPILKRYGTHPFERKLVPELTRDMIEKLMTNGEASSKAIVENEVKKKQTKSISVTLTEFNSNDDIKFDIPEI